MALSLDQLAGAPIRLTLSTGKVISLAALRLSDLAKVGARIKEGWVKAAMENSKYVHAAAVSEIVTRLLKSPVTDDIMTQEMSNPANAAWIISLMTRGTLTEAEVMELKDEDLLAINAASKAMNPSSTPEEEEKQKTESDFT